MTSSSKAWRGTYTVLITPFSDDGTRVDEAALKRLVDWQIDQGIHGLIPLGSTGEFLSMTPAEQEQVIEICVRQARGRVPVLIGTGAEWTRDAVDKARLAERMGADGVMVIPPFYSTPTPDELFEHYRSIGEAISIPIMVYNNPATANVDLTPDIVARLSRIDNVRYIKESTLEVTRVRDILELCGDRMTVFAGILGYESFWLGAQGWVAVCSNLIPRDSARLFGLVADHADRDQSHALYRRILPVVKWVGGHRYVAASKAGLAYMGLPVGAPRTPRLPLPAADTVALHTCLGALGLQNSIPAWISHRTPGIPFSQRALSVPTLSIELEDIMTQRLTSLLIRTTMVAAAALTLGTVKAQNCTPAVANSDLVKPGTLVMSTNPTLPPMQFVDSTGVLKGMRITLGDEIAKRLCLKPEYIKIEFSAMVPGLQAGRWDVINTGIFWTEERAKLMQMVQYESQAISISVAKGNPLKITKPEDLAGRSVGVELGGFEERKLKELAAALTAKGLKPINIRTFDNFATAYQALRAGQTEATVTIDSTGAEYAKRGEFDRALSGLFPTPVALAMKSPALAAAVVKVMNDMQKDGTYGKLMSEYGLLANTAPFKINGPTQ